MDRIDTLQTVYLTLDQRPRRTPRIKKRKSLIKSLLLTLLLNRRRTWGAQEQPLNNECLEGENRNNLYQENNTINSN